ncbi:cation:proton antiporter [Streptomyces oceani]|uniref:cation:proton antiporter n=1 Tax=Streptomyces oceani TaxID=1075402 RepID=UPI0009A10FAB|nr:monovalent cation/H(+) antiporter subunit G [Streptomyces oceani]
MVDVVTAVLVLSGSLFCLSAAIGVLRFSDALSRLQALAKAQAVGLVLVLIGAAVRVPAPYAGLLVLIALFQLLTAPVTGQILGRIGYRTGAVDHERLYCDELAAHLEGAHGGERIEDSPEPEPEPESEAEPPEAQGPREPADQDGPGDPGSGSGRGWDGPAKAP